MLHCTGMSGVSTTSHTKQRLTSIDTAIALGADAISLQANFDGQNDAHNLQLIGDIVDDARGFGLPVLAMIYDVHPESRSTDRLRHLIRIAVELGVDAIKIAPPTDLQELPALVASLSSDVDIFVAGGELRGEAELIALAERALDAGIAGLCIGRNIFQSRCPERVLDALHALIASNGSPRPNASSYAISPYPVAQLQSGSRPDQTAVQLHTLPASSASHDHIPIGEWGF